MVVFNRIHICGAPGSGVSTLGKSLAAQLGYSFFDADDYYWFTGDALPYRRKRNSEHRLRLLWSDLNNNKFYVLSGALTGWGEPVLEQVDLVVYRWLPADIRLERIRTREAERYGPQRILPGGDLNAVFEKFLAWAAQYDSSDAEGRRRTRIADMRGLERIAAPKLFLDQDISTAELIVEIQDFINRQ